MSLPSILRACQAKSEPGVAHAARSKSFLPHTSCRLTLVYVSPSGSMISR
jgi:hypothetical protein